MLIVSALIKWRYGVMISPGKSGVSQENYGDSGFEKRCLRCGLKEQKVEIYHRMLGLERADVRK